MRFKEIKPSHIFSIHYIIISFYNLSKGYRNKGLVDSILAKIDYLGYDNIYDRAALLLEGIIRLHQFIDGNKRVALDSVAEYLKLNNYSLIFPLSSIAFVHKIANKKDTDPDNNEMLIKEIAEWLQSFSFPTKPNFINRVKIKHVSFLHYKIPLFLIYVSSKLKSQRISKFILKTYFEMNVKEVDHEFIKFIRIK